MYESFYQLQTNPFRLTPDPKFCFSHSGYKLAHEYLEYALKLGEGFVIITGRPGTGKTTLVEYFLSSLDINTVTAATIAASNLDPEDLLRAVAYAYGLDAEGHDKATLRRIIKRYFEEQLQSGRRVLLIIDEAQGLPRSALEELRLLADLQTDARQLLQLFIVGQEQLREQMSDPDMEHFKQRVIANYNLAPLGLMESRAYVEYRLCQAGWQGDPELTGAAVLDIYRFSKGVPRYINKLCNRLLLLGYGKGSHKLDNDDVQAIAKEMDAEQLRPLASEQPVDEDAVEAQDIPEFNSGSLSLNDLAIKFEGQTDIEAAMSISPVPGDEVRPFDRLAGQSDIGSLSLAHTRTHFWQSLRDKAKWLTGMARWQEKQAFSLVMLTFAILSIAAVMGIFENEESYRGASLAGKPELTRPLATYAEGQQTISSVVPGDKEHLLSGQEMVTEPSVVDATHTVVGSDDINLQHVLEYELPSTAAGLPKDSTLTVDPLEPSMANAVQVSDTGEQYPVDALIPGTAPASGAGVVLASLEQFEPDEIEKHVLSTGQAKGNNIQTVGSREAEIEYLMMQGHQALEDFRLLTPEQDSAYHYFQNILKLAPDNAEAHDGIEQIVVRYELLANRALEQKDEVRADLYIARGLGIQPDNSELLALKGRSRVPIITMSVEEGEIVQKKSTGQKVDDFFSRMKTFFNQQ